MTTPPPARAAPRRGRAPGGAPLGARMATLLDAATAVFAERGFAQARLDEVAARAGVKVGTLYRLFPSKHVIADALEARVLANIQAHYTVDHATVARMDLDALTAFLLGASAAFAENPGLVVDPALAPRLAGERWTRARAWLAGHVATLLRARFPGLAAPAAEAAAAICLGHARMMIEFAPDPAAAAAAAMLHQLVRLHLAHVASLATTPPAGAPAAGRPAARASRPAGDVAGRPVNPAPRRRCDRTPAGQ